MGLPKQLGLVLAAGLVVAPILAQDVQTPTFRAGTKTVSLYATVTEGGRLVPGLSREDFEILDDGKPQAVTVFSAEILPITVVVMLDTSGSMTSNIETLKAGAEQFFLRLFKGDRARLGAFNDKIQWASERVRQPRRSSSRRCARSTTATGRACTTRLARAWKSWSVSKGGR